MNVERRATRRSTSDQLLAEVSINPKELVPVANVVVEELAKEGAEGRNGNGASNGGGHEEVENEDNSNITPIDEEEDGAPKAKLPKLDVDEVDEQSNQSGGDLGKPKGGKRGHQCPECEKKFQKKGALTKHLKAHLQARPFVCSHEDCDKTFTNVRAMEKHVKSVHEGEGDVVLHLCPFCQKGFITRAEMDNHAETHLDEYKMYACRYCGKSFVKKFAMKIAVQASQGGVPEPCPYCTRAINPKAYKDN